MPESTLKYPAAQSLFILGQLAEIVEEKLRTAASSRRYDLFLIASWLYTVALTCVVFAFVYVGLDKIDPAAFRSAENASYWSFLGFSFEVLSPAKLSAIAAASSTASVAYYLEACCSIIVLVILVFTVLTAAREAFRHDVEAFSEELKLTANAADSRIAELYNMTLAQLEVELLKDQWGLVNLLRRMRGLPELKLTPPQVGA